LPTRGWGGLLPVPADLAAWPGGYRKAGAGGELQQ